MLDLFDGSADIRRYERTPFVPRQCELMAFESYDKYTLTRLLFEGRDTFLFLIKGSVSVEQATNGTFPHFIGSRVSASFSVGGLTYIANAKSVRLQGASEKSECFAGFTREGVLRLIPGGVVDAADSGIIHGSDASPFLIVNGKRLAIKDEAKRNRDRLVLGQLRTGEAAFIFIKGVDVARAADYAFQLGCECAAVIGNEKRVDIYARGLVQDRQSGCKAAFVVR